MRRPGFYMVKRYREARWEPAEWRSSPYPSEGMCWLFWDRTIHRGRVHRVGPRIEEP